MIMQRKTGFIPLICAFTAMILSFLCLFAGNSPGFMQDFSLVTLDTSRFAQNLDFSEDLTDNSNGFEDLIEEVAGSAEEYINFSIGNLVHKTGLQDFYSAHIMNYCSGMYSNGPETDKTDAEDDTENDTEDDTDDDTDKDTDDDTDETDDTDEEEEVEEIDIRKNSGVERKVLFCSDKDALYHFDPLESIKKSVNEAGLGEKISAEVIDALPDELDDAMTALRSAYRAIFVLYCMGIALAFLSMLFSLLGIFFTKRIYLLVNAALANLAFLSLGIASAVVTAIIIQGEKAVNKFGASVGIVALRGNKFLGITWAATLLMLVAFGVWLVHILKLKRQVAKMG